MKKMIYFDLDGTIADLYAVEDWLPKLRNEDVSPYIEAAPMGNLPRILEMMEKLSAAGWEFGVISWTSKGGSETYNRQVRAAKIEWLKVNGFYPFMKEIHCVKYGTPKHLVPNSRKCILIDDNEEVCRLWDRYGGMSANPNEEAVCEILHSLLSY